MVRNNPFLASTGDLEKDWIEVVNAAMNGDQFVIKWCDSGKAFARSHSTGIE